MSLKQDRKFNVFKCKKTQNNVKSLDDIKPKPLVEDVLNIQKREKWGKALDFFIACVGFSVGLGNVWRFPYLCYNNGGGAFLLPYLICVIIGGLPLFYLEISLGQFMSISGIHAWKICPIFKGIGLACFVTMFTVNCYYNVVICWALYYMFASFTSVLPWSNCNNTWNTNSCTLFISRNTSNNLSMTYMNYSSINRTTGDNYNWTDPVTEFWENKVLALSGSIEDTGGLKWDVTLCFLLSWIIIYLCIFKGIKSSGKVMYFTALMPYVLLVAMLIRGVTLSGSLKGILYYVTPQFDKIASLKVWVDAGTQIFFSYAIALGTLTALGSYNKFSHNSYRDAIAFTFVNSGTSLFSGFVVFSILGHMSVERGVPMDQVAEKGPGLAFLVYPRALMEMTAAPAWSVIFFFTIILLGIDSQFVGVESIISFFVDQYPRTWRVKYGREKLTAIICAVTFLVGLSMCSRGGMYVFLIFDYYGGSKIILLVAFCECVAIAWIYGIDRFYGDITSMLGFRINRFIYVCWVALSPLFCVGIFIMSMVEYSGLTYTHNNITYEYPSWSIAIGWLMAFSSVVCIPIVASTEVIQRKRRGIPLALAIKDALKPAFDNKDHAYEKETSIKLFELNSSV